MKDSVWFGQPHRIKIWEKNLTSKCGMFGARYPKVLIQRPVINSEKISAKDQQEYWLGVLLCLVKHLCPDHANATREL